ncbi:MAG: HAMP domain-containing histidine kinase [Magnetococcales bacterium]|nr:HAMP domain-containing histidine kinase [Magnetococcales bacterium]
MMAFGFPMLKKLLPNLRGVSLTLKALLLTVTLGVVFWAFNNYFQTEYQKRVFNDYLLVELHKRAQSDWGTFDSHLRIQMQASKLLVERSEFIEYIEKLEARNWADDKDVAPTTTMLAQSKWLPKRSILRGLVRSSHFLLLDPKNRIREIFQNSLTELPSSLLPNLYDDMVGVKSRNTILVDKGKPFLFAKVSLLDIDEEKRATLILVTAIDDDFLLNLQLENKSEGVLVFLDQEGTRVVASSRPDLVESGVLVEALKTKYLILEKSFFDYGFLSEYFVQFATLIPISQIQTLNETISYAGRTQRGIAHIVMVFITVMIVVWLVGHIKDFTNEMLHFTREYLGFEPSKAQGGDQLQVMKDQFRLLSNEIIAFRKQETIHKEELLEANKALSQSLVMVKRTQAQLVEAEKMAALGGLVAGVAHEINTPLGIGMTAASFLQSRCQDSARLLAEEKLKKSELDAYFAEATESSSMILTNLTRAAKLIRSFKQIAVDQASEDKRKFNLKNYIEQVLISFEHRLRHTNHKVSVSCPDDLECYSYPGVLSQIITNFIENSLIHGYKEKESGVMLIDVSVINGQLVIRYKDDGKGIKEEHRKKIFEPFFTTNRSQGGSGLGMNIVYNLVTQTIGGKIECISKEGNGVDFIITFPELEHEAEVIIS